MSSNPPPKNICKKIWFSAELVVHFCVVILVVIAFAICLIAVVVVGINEVFVVAVVVAIVVDVVVIGLNFAVQFRSAFYSHCRFCTIALVYCSATWSIVMSDN